MNTQILVASEVAELHTKKLIILSGTPFQNNFEELRTIMRLLLPANDEAMDFLNPLTLDNVTYKRVDQEKNGPFSAHPEWRHFVKSFKG
jgi:DNA repair and recombination RAD54-like protein